MNEYECKYRTADLSVYCIYYISQWGILFCALAGVVRNAVHRNSASYCGRGVAVLIVRFIIFDYQKFSDILELYIFTM